MLNEFGIIYLRKHAAKQKDNNLYYIYEEKINN